MKLDYINQNTNEVLQSKEEISEYGETKLNDIILLNDVSYRVVAKQKLANNYKIFLKE